MRQIRLQPIREETFAPFGQLIRHPTSAVIADVSRSFVADTLARLPVVEWVRPLNASVLPFRVNRLERHPFSAQTFIPDGRTPFIAMVCPSDASGAPDLLKILAFEVPSDTGVTFHRGVWHHALAPLAQPSRFVMAMMRTGLNNDTEFFELPAAQPVEVGAQ